MSPPPYSEQPPSYEYTVANPPTISALAAVSLSSTDATARNTEPEPSPAAAPSVHPPSYEECLLYTRIDPVEEAGSGDLETISPPLLEL